MQEKKIDELKLRNQLQQNVLAQVGMHAGDRNEKNVQMPAPLQLYAIQTPSKTGPHRTNNELVPYPSIHNNHTGVQRQPSSNLKTRY